MIRKESRNSVRQRRHARVRERVNGTAEMPRLVVFRSNKHIEAQIIDDIKGVKTNIEWGAQIRSYVFMPYTLAKDNRTGFENGNITAVMDGDIDGFINAYLKYIKIIYLIIRKIFLISYI